MATVHCNTPSGFRLRVGNREVVLRQGVNEIDDDFWAEWFAEYTEDFPPIVDGTILVDAGAPDEPPAPKKSKAKAADAPPVEGES